MWSIEYRPRSLEEFFGNKDVVKRIREYLKLGKLPRTMIFYGESGCGKTTLARIVGSLLGAQVLEFNVANMRGIDTIREVIEVCRYMPLGYERRLIIFDEAHRVTRDGQEAMLKLLEEEDVVNYFILCTTEVEGLIETVRNRAKVFQFRGLSYDEMVELVRWLEGKTGRRWDEEVIMKVWRLSRGVPRIIVNVLEEVRSVEDVDVVFSKVYFSEVGDVVGEIAKAMRDGVLSWRVFQSRVRDLDEKELLGVFEALKSYFVKVLLSTEDNKWVWYGYIVRELAKGRDLASYLSAILRIIEACRELKEGGRV